MPTDLVAVLVASAIVIKLIVSVRQATSAIRYEWHRARACVGERQDG